MALRRWVYNVCARPVGATLAAFDPLKPPRLTCAEAEELLLAQVAALHAPELRASGRDHEVQAVAVEESLRGLASGLALRTSTSVSGIGGVSPFHRFRGYPEQIPNQRGCTGTTANCRGPRGALLTVCLQRGKGSSANVSEQSRLPPRKRAMVPRRGLEPPRLLHHWHLKPARLPIPPPGRALRAQAGADRAPPHRRQCGAVATAAAWRRAFVAREMALRRVSAYVGLLVCGTGL